MWHCHCDCGGWRITTGKQLRKGLATQCVGCRSLDEAIEDIGVPPCDKQCHFRLHCMAEHLACWPYRMWVTKGEDMEPNPEDFRQTPESGPVVRVVAANDATGKQGASEACFDLSAGSAALVCDGLDDGFTA